jgi:alpha/beta superfamily hydrolase
LKELHFSIDYAKASLAAVLTPASKSRLVIVCHGFTGYKSENRRLFVNVARALAKAGISSLRFDFMGSGDSSGEFYQMSPNTEIRDLKQVIRWAKKKGYRKIGILGLSFGGGVTICTAAQVKDKAIQTIVTWSSVPSFRFWIPKLRRNFYRKKPNPMSVGRCLFSDWPKEDVPEAFCSLKIPKLQIQGDEDLPGFVSAFKKYFKNAPNPKSHIILPGADHVFTNWNDRAKVISQSVKWFKKYLKP